MRMTYRVIACNLTSPECPLTRFGADGASLRNKKSEFFVIHIDVHI